MDLQVIRILPKHICQWENPISMSAYTGNCEPGHREKENGPYQQGGYQWETYYDCDKRTWFVKRSEGLFEATGALNIYLDKWYHKKEIQPTTILFDPHLMTVRLEHQR